MGDQMDQAKGMATQAAGDLAGDDDLKPGGTSTRPQEGSRRPPRSTHITNDPGPTGRELLVVYPTLKRAETARARVLELGVDPLSVRVDEETDEIASLRAEMHEELTQAWIVPTAAFIAPKEGVKGMGFIGAVAILVSLLIAIPLAFIDFGATLGVRLLVFSAVAVALGGTIGFVAGAAAAAKRPGERMAAHRGTVVRVGRDTPELRRALLDLEPIRVDEVAHDDTPIDTVVTEGDRQAEGTVEEVGANLQGDDYRPEAHPERG